IEHHESRELPVYILAVSKAGLKLKTSSSSGKQSATIMSKPQQGGARATGKGAPVSVLADFLEAELGFSVLDKTGLTQTYDFTLEYAPHIAALRAAALRSSGITDPDELSFPELVTAVQEQLGLKLERAKAPYDVLVVDHVEKMPTEN